MRLITILKSLRDQPRRLTDEENLYIEHITDEIRRAQNDAARWQILEREGINRPDVMDFDQEVLATLTTLHRAAMN